MFGSKNDQHLWSGLKFGTMPIFLKCSLWEKSFVWRKTSFSFFIFYFFVEEIKDFLFCFLGLNQRYCKKTFRKLPGVKDAVRLAIQQYKKSVPCIQFNEVGRLSNDECEESPAVFITSEAGWCSGIHCAFSTSLGEKMGKHYIPPQNLMVNQCESSFSRKKKGLFTWGIPHENGGFYHHIFQAVNPFFSPRKTRAVGPTWESWHIARPRGWTSNLLAAIRWAPCCTSWDMPLGWHMNKRDPTGRLVLVVIGCDDYSNPKKEVGWSWSDPTKKVMNYLAIFCLGYWWLLCAWLITCYNDSWDFPSGTSTI